MDAAHIYTKKHTLVYTFMQATHTETYTQTFHPVLHVFLHFFYILGGTRFFLSLEDDIFKIFGADKMSGKGIRNIMASYSFTIIFLFLSKCLYISIIFSSYFVTVLDVTA
jgi:hypothetical protein